MNSDILSDRRVLINGLLLALALPATILRAQPCVAGAGEGETGTPSVVIPSFLDAWQTKYPTSTLPARMQAASGRDCNVCHHPPSLNTQGNCYRDDLAQLLLAGQTIEQALDQLDTADSDGDGVANGDEIRAARPEVGQVGYNPGLVGDTGTDPCGTNPSQPVTGVPETPPPPVPAVSAWGTLILSIVLAISASLVMRKAPSVAGQSGFGGR